MPEYRVYIIGSDGYFQKAVPLICTDDTEAVGEARKFVDGHDIELWQLNRKIAMFRHGALSESIPDVASEL